MIESLTAVILAGGKGTRMAPWVAPKVLVPVNGRPILHRLLRHLNECRVGKFVICTGHRSQDVVISLAHTDEGNLNWTSTRTDPEATIAARLRDAFPRFKGPALVCYGDELADVDLEGLCEHHEATKAEVTITVFRMKSPFGAVVVDSKNEVVGFEEKAELPFWFNIGFIVFSENAKERFVDCDFEFPAYLDEMAARGLVSAWAHRGRRVTVNSFYDLEAAEREWK